MKEIPMCILSFLAGAEQHSIYRSDPLAGLVPLFPATMSGPSKCYNLAGEFVPEFTVCNLNNGTAGLCCLIGDQCQSDYGLCKSSSGELYQGGCTDSSYESSQCTTFCDGNLHPDN